MKKLFNNLFKKKEEDVNYSTDSVKTSNKTSKATYAVEIKEKFGTATTTLKTIKAERFIDQDDHVVYLRNVEMKFLELFPQDENDFEKLDKKQIETNLKKARETYNKELIKDTEEVNEKNILFEIMKYEAKLRALKYSSDCSYMTILENGTKKFYFLREGSTFYPFKWDVHNSTIYVANDNKKKKAGIARRNKAIKYSKFKNAIEGSIMFIMILNIVFLLGNGMVAYKFFSKFDESEIIKAQNYCVQKSAEWTAINQKNAEITSSILDSIQQKIKGENIIMDNFVPKELETTS